MRRFRKIAATAAATFAFFCAGAQEGRLIVPQGDYSMGLQFAVANFNSENSELLLLLNPIDASGRATLVAPFAEYSYRDNRSIGARLSFFSGNAVINELGLDMLNDGLSFDLSDIKLGMSSFGISIFHRNYLGLDERGRAGLFAEFALGYTGGTTGDSKSTKLELNFSPGFVFFLMDNVSVSCSLSMAGLNYTSVKTSDGGSRSKFGVRAGVDLLGLNFGVSFHF